MSSDLNDPSATQETVLVPREPTKEMIQAGIDKLEECTDYAWDSTADGDTHEYTILRSDWPAQVYRAMLAVAPKP